MSTHIRVLAAVALGHATTSIACGGGAPPPVQPAVTTPGELTAGTTGAATSTPAGPGSAVDVVVVRLVEETDPDGPSVSLVRTAEGCRLDPFGFEVTVADELTIGPGWQILPGGAGRAVFGPDWPPNQDQTALIGNVVDQAGPPRRISLVHPSGRFLSGLVIEADRITILARDERPARVVARVGGQIRVLDPDGRPTGELALGSTDLLLVAWTVSSMPPAGQAVFACEYLTSSGPPR